MEVQKRQTQTKDILKTALIQLLQEKDFEAITVSDISRTAGVNRGTFYLHYVDKFDMMNQLEKEILHHILTLLHQYPITQKQEAYPAVVQIFEYLKEEFEFIHAVATSRFTYTNQLVRKFLIELMEKMDSIKQNLKQELPMPEDYAREVFIYSNSAIIFHWILKGGVESPEEITKIFLGMCQE